jgi:hypothetical protein
VLQRGREDHRTADSPTGGEVVDVEVKQSHAVARPKSVALVLPGRRPAVGRLHLRSSGDDAAAALKQTPAATAAAHHPQEVCDGKFYSSWPIKLTDCSKLGNHDALLIHITIRNLLFFIFDSKGTRNHVVFLIFI